MSESLDERVKEKRVHRDRERGKQDILDFF